MGTQRYVLDEAELEHFWLHVKLMRCPHCGFRGALIAHGLLVGYSESSSSKEVRGRRVFCSNRHRRPGCGRTFSVLFAHILSGFIVRARTLLRFARGVIAGRSRKSSFNAVATTMSTTTGYRLWRRLERSQVRLRTILFREGPPPPSNASKPLALLLAHLEQLFPVADCVFAAFQHRFQTSLLG